jgi:hypothetical protein
MEKLSVDWGNVIAHYVMGLSGLATIACIVAAFQCLSGLALLCGLIGALLGPLAITVLLALNKG